MNDEKKHKLLFLDLETDGLFGKPLEFAAMDENGNIYQVQADINSIKELLMQHADEVVVVWHRWWSEWMKLHMPDVPENIYGRAVALCDVGMVLLDRRSIDGITFKLLGRHHEGNALQDVKDLYDCFNRMRLIFDKGGRK